MPFNHDNMLGVRLAEDLVNLRVDGGWADTRVVDLLRQGLVRVDRVARDELDALGAWSERLGGVFQTPTPAVRCEAVNGLLDEAVRRVHLAMHDGLPAHLHFAGGDEDLVQRVKATTAGGIAVFAVEAGAGRMGACPRPGCGRVFADTSRNGRRAYCSARCANGSAVQRYRHSRRSTAT